MPTINQLASISQVSGSAQIPVYDQNNGDARKMSVNTLLDYFQTSFAAPTVSTNLYTPGAGFNITVPTPVAEQQWMLIQPAGTLATGTVTLPLNTGVPDGTEVLITSTQTITAFTIALNGAAAIFGNISNLTAGAAIRYRYYLATNSWYNIVNDFNSIIAATNLVLSGSASIGTTLGVTGLSTLTGGAVIQGLTVGLGAGATSTNTAVGTTALNTNATGALNVAVGFESLYTGTAISSSVGVGYRALRASTGSRNVAVGAFSMDGTVGASDCVAVGRNTLRLLVGNGQCTAIGTDALTLATGQHNTALGYGAGENITSGAGNIAFSGYTSAGSNAPVFNITTQDNRISMGSTSVTNAYIQVAWTAVSDARDKTDFAPVPHGLDFVSKLQPTAYRYKETRDATEGHGPLRYGFKAQDVLALEGNAPVIVDAEDLNKLRFNDQSMIAVLVNAIKELKAEFDAYKAAHA